MQIKTMLKNSQKEEIILDIKVSLFFFLIKYILTLY